MAETSLKLPGINISCSGEQLDIAVMVLGGRAPSAGWLRKIPCSEVWAVDRGLEACRRAAIAPDIVIGDGDSCSAETLSWAEQAGVPFERFNSDKDLTDFQLALRIFAQKNKNTKKNIFLTGAFGGRFDHLWSLTASFVNFQSSQVPFCIADDREGVLLLHGEESASLEFSAPPKAISLIPFTQQCCGVSIDGARWLLKDRALRFAEPFSISNRLESGNTARISVSSGTLGAYWIFHEEDPDISAH